MRRKQMIISVVALAAMLLVLTGCAALGIGGGGTDAEFPSQQINMMVNFGAGGGTDLTSRALAAAAETILGVPIVVTNVTGGGGSVAVAELALQPTDGYHIGVVTMSPLAIHPWVMPDVIDFTIDDFDFILAHAQFGYGLVVGNHTPFYTVDDLIEYALAAGQMNFGSTGFPQPFAMYAINDSRGTNFVNVNYAETAALVTDLLGGFLDVALIDQATFAPHIAAGSIRLLASASDSRWDSEPHIPTLYELGFGEGTALLSFMGIAAPAGIDPGHLQILRDAFSQAHQSDEFQAVVAANNLIATYLTGPEYARVAREHLEMYAFLAD